MASEFEEAMVKKYKGKLPEDYIRAVVGLKENNVNRRFLVPGIECEKSGIGVLERLWKSLKFW